MIWVLVTIHSALHSFCCLLCYAALPAIPLTWTYLPYLRASALAVPFVWNSLPPDICIFYFLVANSFLFKCCPLGEASSDHPTLWKLEFGHHTPVVSNPLAWFIFLPSTITFWWCITYLFFQWFTGYPSALENLFRDFLILFMTPSPVPISTQYMAGTQ